MESDTFEQGGRRLISPGDQFVVDLPIRWGDCDALQHLNNTAYFRLMEEGRMQMLSSAGVPQPKGQGAIIVHASCDYLRSFTYPSTVRVTHKVQKVGRTSMEFEVILARADDPETPYARGRTVGVWMDLRTGTPIPWPEAILAGVGASLTPVVPAPPAGAA